MLSCVGKSVWNPFSKLLFADNYNIIITLVKKKKLSMAQKNPLISRKTNKPSYQMKEKKYQHNLEGLNIYFHACVYVAVYMLKFIYPKYFLAHV